MLEHHSHYVLQRKQGLRAHRSDSAVPLLLGNPYPPPIVGAAGFDDGVWLDALEPLKLEPKDVVLPPKPGPFALPKPGNDAGELEADEEEKLFACLEGVLVEMKGLPPLGTVLLGVGKRLAPGL